MAQVSEAEIAALRASGFDPNWYLEQYPDVKLVGVEPALHYLWLGRALGRKPGPTGATEQPLTNLLSTPKPQKRSWCDPQEYFFGSADGFASDEGVSRLMLYVWKSRPDLAEGV